MKISPDTLSREIFFALKSPEKGQKRDVFEINTLYKSKNRC